LSLYLLLVLPTLYAFSIINVLWTAIITAEITDFRCWSMVHFIILDSFLWNCALSVFLILIWYYLILQVPITDHTLFRHVWNISWIDWFVSLVFFHTSYVCLFLELQLVFLCIALKHFSILILLHKLILVLKVFIYQIFLSGYFDGNIGMKMIRVWIWHDVSIRKPFRQS